MLKRIGPQHRIRVDGGHFVVHDQEGERLFQGTHQEVEAWLDQRENETLSQPSRPRASLMNSVLKMMRRDS